MNSLLYTIIGPGLLIAATCISTGCNYAEKSIDSENVKHSSMSDTELISNEQNYIDHESTQEPDFEEYSVNLGNNVRMRMVWIPGGSFMMGSPDSEDGGSSSERPQTEVSIEGFWIGKYEVTQAQYEEIMGNFWFAFEGDNNPAEMISWYDAVEFCENISYMTGDNYQLPTEAHWEYACRAGSETAFYWGADDSRIGDYAWWGENSGNTTHIVGSKQPNAWGLYDMIGNVFEWTLTDYEGYPYVWDDGRNDLTGDGMRVIRGWSCADGFNFTKNCRSAWRYPYSPDVQNYDLGFRCIRIP